MSSRERKKLQTTCLKTTLTLYLSEMSSEHLDIVLTARWNGDRGGCDQKYYKCQYCAVSVPKTNLGRDYMKRHVKDNHLVIDAIQHLTGFSDIGSCLENVKGEEKCEMREAIINRVKYYTDMCTGGCAKIPYIRVGNLRWCIYCPSEFRQQEDIKQHILDHHIKVVFKERSVFDHFLS